METVLASPDHFFGELAMDGHFVASIGIKVVRFVTYGSMRCGRGRFAAARMGNQDVLFEISCFGISGEVSGIHSTGHGFD